MNLNIPKKDINQTLKVIDELQRNFPMIAIEDINFEELKKVANITKMQFLSLIVFMDYFKSQSVYIDTNDVKKINVKKSKNEWKFTIYSNQYPTPLKFKHPYTFSF